MGLTQSHAYGILNVVEESDSNGTHKLIQVLNPWAKSRGEWKGKWSDSDTRSWTRRMRQRLKYTPNKSKEDGRFYISYSDFVQRFTELYVCHRFTNDWTMYAMNAAWAPGTNGGFRALQNCPQFAFKIDRPTNVAICMTQGGFNAGGLNGEACVVFSVFGGSSYGESAWIAMQVRTSLVVIRASYELESVPQDEYDRDSFDSRYGWSRRWIHHCLGNAKEES